MLAKHSAPSFPISESKSSALFDLVHYDIWGPTHVLSMGGFSYYVCFFYNYLCFIWFHFMRHRSDVFQIYANFIIMVHTQFNQNVFPLHFVKTLLLMALYLNSPLPIHLKRMVLLNTSINIFSRPIVLFFYTTSVWPKVILTSIYLIN